MQREKLADLLDRWGAGDEEAQQQLLDYIMQQPEGIRVLAFEALQDGGDDTYEQLMLTLADDPDLLVRPSKRSEPLAEDADLSELHPIAQQAGQEWQARVSAGRAPQALLDQLAAGKRHERIVAARSLAEYQDPATIGPLIAVVRSDDRLVAAAAVEALQQIGKVAVPALIDLLGESNEQLRWSAAKALSTIADERAVVPLVRALEDKNYGTRWLAAEGLARTGRPALAPLLRRLAEGKPSAWLRQGAWHVLNKIDLPNDEERRHYKEFGAEIKRSSASTIAGAARAELKRLDQAG